ncbi:MAG: hypothetical protein HYT13_02770 [Candidatus Liptonbacteria bacterium]|nr:hypothetical protein [Candidatus Liptonbacteria bacterium]
MRSKNRFIIILLGLLLTGFSGFLFFFSDFIVQATHNPSGSNINSFVDEHWAWNDAIGWIDFHSTDNVIVKSQLIEGYASSSAKELSLDCSTAPDGSGGETSVCPPSPVYKVINDGCGSLSGWAWNEVYGWTSFNCSNHGGCGTGPGSSTYSVFIGGSGEFFGYAWSDVIGWISFNCFDPNTGGSYCATSQHSVVTTWIPSSTSAYLDSSTFDTGVQGGAQLNSIMWLGGFTSATSTCAGPAAWVGFQIAATSTPNGPWNFVGPDNTPNTFYSAFPASQSGVSIPLDYTLHNNQRYFRYRVLLFSDQSQSQSPRVDDVIINWSP